MTTEAPSSSPEVAVAASTIQGEEKQDRFAVTPGKCTIGGDSECWLSPQNCDGEYEFSIPKDDEKDSSIICPTSSVNDIQVGSCMYGGLGGVISILCSPNEESCPAGTSFIPPNEGSTNNNCSVETTKFGSCAGGCRYNPKDCPSGEQNSAWIFPDYDCTCDKVQVGICVFKNSNDQDDPLLQNHPTMCSVNEEACGDDEDTIFIPTNQVREMFGFDCYLCGDSSPPPVTLPSETLPTEVVVTSPPAPPSSSQDQKDIEWEKLKGEAQQQEGNENNNNKSRNGGGGAIIALLIIGITVALVVSAVTYWKRRRQQQGRKEANNLSQVNTKSTEEEDVDSKDVEEDVPQQDYAVTKEVVEEEEEEEDFPQDYEDFPQEDLLLKDFAVTQDEVEDYEDFPQVDPVVTYEDFPQQEEDDSVMTEEDDNVFSQEQESVGMYEDFPHDEEPYDEIDDNSMPSMV